MPRRNDAENLILKYGRNSFSWQILNPGNTLWFSKDETAVTGYVLEGRTRIAAGAPVTDPSNLKKASAEFEEDARGNGHHVCYFGAQAWLKEIFQGRDDHRTVLLGAQPVWSPLRWNETLSKNASVRELIRRAVRLGIEIREVPAGAAKNQVEYRECIEDWTRSKKLPSFGFLLHTGVLNENSGRRFFSAFSGGRLEGFLTLTPISGRNGWLIEHIFRGRKSSKGMSELLVDNVMKTLAAEGAEHATFGLAPLSKMAGLSYHMNPLWLRITFRWLYAKASKFYNFSGLDTFKSKFRPHRWEPVYAIVNKPQFCPVTFYRIASAFCSTSPVLFGMTALSRAIAGE